MSEMKRVLQSEYGVTANEMVPTVGGWSALAYKVNCVQQQYFLKVYEKKRSGITEVLEKLNLSMAVSSWLESNTSLRGRINAPLLTQSGDAKVETEAHVYVLFHHIDGETICTT